MTQNKAGKMKLIPILTTLLLFSGTLFAADQSEKGVPTSPVTAYSGGFGIGAIYALNPELREKSEQFMKLSFINTLYFSNNASLFMDFDWLAPGNNSGMDMGFDLLLADGPVNPFMGMGVGIHILDKEGQNFGQNFGPSATIHMGMLLDLTDAMQIRIRVPYHLVGNAARDQGIGIDIGFLFKDRFSHVKKLNYR